MKIVDLKCPSCGGKLVPMEGNPKIVVCEYCNRQCVLEEDNVINYHIHQYGAGGVGGTAGTGGVNNCPPGRNVPIQHFPEESSGIPKAAIAAIAGLAAAAAVFVGIRIIAGNSKPSGGAKEETRFTVAADYLPGEEAKDEIDQAEATVKESLGEPSPLYEEMVIGMF